MNGVFVGLLKAHLSKYKCHNQTLISVGICSLGLEVLSEGCNAWDLIRY